MVHIYKEECLDKHVVASPADENQRNIFTTYMVRE